jgi:ribosomal protein S18 acetylase RimI-like enzyme
MLSDSAGRAALRAAHMEIGAKSIAIHGGRVVSFRPVAAGDDPFLLSVYASTREEELALTSWNNEQRAAFISMQFDAQHLHYRGEYPSAEYLLILLNWLPVGRLYIADTQKEIKILDISVLPEHRGAGIGTAIINQLIQQAQARGKALAIYVESFNRSLGLFERLGFVRSGESGYSVLLQWRAESAVDGHRSVAGL